MSQNIKRDLKYEYQEENVPGDAIAVKTSARIGLKIEANCCKLKYESFVLKIGCYILQSNEVGDEDNLALNDPFSKAW